MIIIDVREPTEYNADHVECALNIPPAELMAGSGKLTGIPKGEQIILYCLSGSRSNVSAQILQAQGFTSVSNGINKDHVANQFGLPIK